MQETRNWKLETGKTRRNSVESPADRKRFYRYARGSFEETKAWLRKAIRRGVISLDADVEQFTQVIDDLGPKLNAFINTTGK